MSGKGGGRGAAGGGAAGGGGACLQAGGERRVADAEGEAAAGAALESGGTIISFRLSNAARVVTTSDAAMKNFVHGPVAPRPRRFML